MSHQAMALSLLAFVACSQTAVALSGHRGFLSLAAKMQPEVVAQTLSKVQDQWRAQVTDFLRCNATSGDAEECSDAPKAFGKSCGTVATAVVQASSGDRSVVREYMGDVCAEPVLTGWRQDQCEALADQLTSAMTENSFDNRNNFQAEGPCSSLFSRLAGEERQRLREEEAAEAERKEEEQKMALEAAAKVAEEAKRAAEESKSSPNQAKAVTDTAQTVTEAPVTEHVIVFNAAASANGTGSEAALPSSDTKEEAADESKSGPSQGKAVTDTAQTVTDAPVTGHETVFNAAVLANGTGNNGEAVVLQSTQSSIGNASMDNKQDAGVNATTDKAEAGPELSASAEPTGRVELSAAAAEAVPTATTATTTGKATTTAKPTTTTTTTVRDTQLAGGDGAVHQPGIEVIKHDDSTTLKVSEDKDNFLFVEKAAPTATTATTTGKTTTTAKPTTTTTTTTVRDTQLAGGDGAVHQPGIEVIKHDDSTTLNNSEDKDNFLSVEKVVVTTTGQATLPDKINEPAEGNATHNEAK